MSQDSENWHYILNFVKKNGAYLLSHLGFFLIRGTWFAKASINEPHSGG